MNTGTFWLPVNLNFKAMSKWAKRSPGAPITAVTISWKGKHLLNHMLLQHLWIKKGRTQHRLGELCHELVCSRQTKADCVYYKIIYNWSVSKGQSKGRAKVKRDTNAELRRMMLLGMWTGIHCSVSAASITATSLQTQGFWHAKKLKHPPACLWCRQ